VELTAVPETMLWTLHNRASEAARPDGVLRDPTCLEIYRSLPYDYERSFGRAEPSHAVRSVIFDGIVREFVARCPDAVIVNLGEGLETQRFRVPTGPGVLWLAVDLPEAIEVRERFIRPDRTHRHVPASALDRSWFDAVPAGRPVLVTAQGLFMYFHEQDLRELTGALVARWPGVELVFDHIPRWLSRRSLRSRGWRKTGHYRVPPLPWGVGRSQTVPVLRSWMGPDIEVVSVPFAFPRGVRRAVSRSLVRIPGVREHLPGITHVRRAPS